MFRKLTTLASVLCLSAIVTGCDSTPYEPVPEPTYSVITGSVFEPGYSPVAVSFSILDNSLQTTLLDGDFQIGRDWGTFNIDLSNPASIFINGETVRCTNYRYNNGSECSSAAEVLHLGLEVTATGIKGSTPPSRGASLVWALTKSVNAAGEEVYSGTVDSEPVEVTVKADGNYVGSVTNGGVRFAVNAYVDPALQAAVPKGSVVALLVTSALNIRSSE